MTISCQTHGPEWGTDGFAEELDRLLAMGVNWVAIHPYARIHGDGRVSTRLDPDHPPVWLTRPLEEARSRGMDVLVKPHLAYWGSPFPWRGEIAFEDPAALARFHSDYRRWILDLARITADASAFCVGTELDRLVGDPVPWQQLIAEVREVTSAHLTYAASWDRVGEVSFWGKLDVIGVQAYHPLVADGEETPRSVEELAGGLDGFLGRLGQLSRSTGKPVVFTELGYNSVPGAALRPWEGAGRGMGPDPELQELCLRAALTRIDEEREWLRGAFLWKWFVGPSEREDFQLDRPAIRELLEELWLSPSSSAGASGQSGER